MAVAEPTFAMADIAGSSRLWNRYPDLMAEALAGHDALATEAVAEHGAIFKHTGDGFLAVFDEPGRAVRAMAGYQRALASHGGSVEIRSRVCVHRGPAHERDGDWFGPALNHLARLTDLVAPTHVVVSAAVADSIDDVLIRFEPLGTFPVRDLPEPVPLFGMSLPDAVGPPLSIAAGRGLPRPRTALVGRAADVDRLLLLLDAGRLVTVTGFGGTGKTRVAIEVAHRWAERQGAPAHFVDLAATRDPMAAIADAVGVPSGRLATENPVHEVVVRHLGDRPVLLLVDNCEHVVDQAADACTTLLEATATVRILATSREPLELDGEAIHTLSPLEPETALELFHDRALAVGATGVSDDVARKLCQRVEHLPLGIELVVARLRQGDPADLLEALDDSLDELRSRRRRTGRSRGADERHSTMRSLVVWSYELLDEDEQRLLVRLAQLPGPWRRTAARAFDARGASARLDELVAKSLVVPGDGGHLRILEPVRQYCAEVLDADPEANVAAREALVGWACKIVAGPSSPDDPVFDAQRARALGEQIPNLRAAVAAARALRRTDAETEIVVGSWPLLLDGRARAWIGPQIDETLSRTTDPTARRALLRMALQDMTSNPVDAERERALVDALRAVEPDESSPAWCVVHTSEALKQAVVGRILGLDPGPTREHLLACEATARRAGHRLDEAIAQVHIASSHLLHRELPAAVVAAERAAESLRRINFVAVVALADAIAALARALDDSDDLQATLTISRSAVALAEHARWESSIRTTYAFLLARAGRVDDAGHEVHTIVELALATPDPAVRFDAAIALASLRRATGDRERAIEALDLAGIGRTPATIFLLYEVATELDFDLGSQRFVDQLDPAALEQRSQRAASYLRAALP